MAGVAEAAVAVAASWPANSLRVGWWPKCLEKDPMESKYFFIATNAKPRFIIAFGGI